VGLVNTACGAEIELGKPDILSRDLDVLIVRKRELKRLVQGQRPLIGQIDADTSKLGQ